MAHTDTEYRHFMYALSGILAFHKEQAVVEADLKDPVRQEWIAESAAGQYLNVATETNRLLDIICWTRQDPVLTTSLPELIEAYGQQLAALLTLALYLKEISWYTDESLVDKLVESYRKATEKQE